MPPNNAQNTGPLLGKILRIDVNGTPGSRQYRIPAVNPFVGRAGRNEIWAYGLRNPWRFSFDRATGDLWIGDVGQNRYEEIDRRQVTSTRPSGRGYNYGWRVMEGRHCYRPASGCNTTGKVIRRRGLRPLRRPLLRDRRLRLPRLAARRSWASTSSRDFCSGEIWSISRGARPPATKTLLRDTALNISSFGEDDNGELYMVALTQRDGLPRPGLIGRPRTAGDRIRTRVR